MAPACAALLMVTQASAYLQSTVAPAYRGRVTSIWAITLVAGVPIGSPIFGWLTDAIGPRLAMTGMSVVVFVVAVGGGLILRRPSNVARTTHNADPFGDQPSTP
jgi:MFS family permease